MEKEQPESMATVTIKPEYAPSEVYSSEPPPAYMKPKSSAVQVARIVAVTVVACSVVLGSFLLASAYVTANASCRQLEQELELLSEAADRFQSASGPLQPEALIQEQPLHKSLAEPLQAEETKKVAKEIDTNSIDNDNDNSSDNSDSSDDSDSSSESEEDDRTPIHFKLPLQLDFDDLAGALIEKNQKSRMNCVVEKKRAEEVVDHQPKTVRLPFGVNLTTDPRYERLSGERMAIFCESGNFQRAQPQPQPQEEDDEQDTIMIQPVMIPIPHSHYPTHMPQQIQPIPQQVQQNQQQMQMMHPMETMRPPMPPMMQQQMQQVQPQMQQQTQMPPNPIIQHIIQQIIAQKIMESQRAQEEQQGQDNSQPDIEQRPPPRMLPQGMIGRLPIPEEVLTQLNRLPNREGIVVVSEQEPEENPQEQEQELQVVQHQRTSPDGMNGRQTYARGLPVNIPVPMMQQDQQDQQEQAAASEEARPHFLQPRSVRSVDALLPKSQKRVKRCSCDCAC